MKHFIGIDLGDKKNEVCVLDKKGEIIDRFEIKNTKAEFLKFFNNYKGSVVAIEVSTHALWIYRLAVESDVKMYVANPRRTSLINSSDRKNDKVDALLLAKLVRADPSLLYPVSLRDIKTQKDLTIIKNRDMLVSLRGDAIRHIRGIIKPFGIKLPKEVTTDNFHETIKEYVSRDTLECIDIFVRQIKSLSKSIKQIDKKIDKLIKIRYPEAIKLQSINGVGPITALTFVLIMGDPSRFKKSRTVGAYLGLIPKQDQSGEMDKSLKITRAGDGMMRRLLVNCTHHILGVYGKDSQLRRHGLKIMGDSGNKIRKKKAVIAISRKLAVTMHRMLVSGETFKNKVSA